MAATSSHHTCPCDFEIDHKSSTVSYDYPSMPEPAKRNAVAADDAPPSKKLCARKSIEVLVGHEKTQFFLRPDLITKRSTFFKAACSERWRKSGSRPLELPDDDPKIFDIYFQCLYFGEIDGADTGQASEEEEDEEEEYRACFHRLTQAWVLSDKLGDIETSNRLITALAREVYDLESVPALISTTYIYTHTTPQSPLRRWLVDLWVHQIYHIEDCKDILEEAPRAFLIDVLVEKNRLENEDGRAVMKTVFRYDFTITDPCRYHYHDSAHPRCEEENEEAEGSFSADDDR